MSKGLSFLAAYTLAKALDNAQGEPANIIQNVYDLNGSRGRTAWDVRQRFVLSGTYEFPFTVKQRVLSRLVNGWSINPILALQAGLPFTPILATAVANTGTFSRPDRIGSGILDNRSPDLYFNTAAFTTPALYHFGNSGRGILTGPGTHQIDANFQKDFAITHDNSRYIQFRAELFNITNTPQFNNPNASIGSPTAGRITGAGDSPNFTRTSRQIQFGLKLYF